MLTMFNINNYNVTYRRIMATHLLTARLTVLLELLLCITPAHDVTMTGIPNAINWREDSEITPSFELFP